MRFCKKQVNFFLKVLFACIMLFLVFPYNIIVYAENTSVFEKDVGEIVYLDNIFYIMSSDGNHIYTWNPSLNGEMDEYCSLPLPPSTWKNSWYTTSFHNLTIEDQKNLTSYVDGISVGDNELWCYNLLGGKVGKIDEKGVEWSKCKIDTSCFFRENGIISYITPIFSFVNNGKLYIFGENNHQVEPIDEDKILFSFDLASGKCEIINTFGTTTLCLYDNEHILLLRKKTPDSMVLSLMNLTSYELKDLPIIVPFGDYSHEGLESVGGLAYNRNENEIYFSMKKKIWRSNSENNFEPVAELPFQSNYSFPAWILCDDKYAIEGYCNLYIRSVK